MYLHQLCIELLLHCLLIVMVHCTYLFIFLISNSFCNSLHLRKANISLSVISD